MLRNPYQYAATVSQVVSTVSMARDAGNYDRLSNAHIQQRGLLSRGLILATTRSD